MNWDEFRNLSKRYSIILFIQPGDVEEKQKEIKELGNQKNVRLVVQPCPYEGIEFLYRVSHELIGHRVSMDRALFWQALILKGDVSSDLLTDISKHHHEYLCAILEQNTKKVAAEGKVLQSFSKHFS